MEGNCGEGGGANQDGDTNKVVEQDRYDDWAVDKLVHCHAHLVSRIQERLVSGGQDGSHPQGIRQQVCSQR